MTVYSVIRKQVVLLLVILSAICIGTPVATAREKQKTSLEQDVLYYINQYREKKGLGPLEYNRTIMEAARRHSIEMARKEVPFGHTGFDERMRSLMTDIKSVNAAAENVAYGDLSAKQVVDLWLHSKGHRRNIEGNYNLTGIGIARASNGTLYFTEIFLHKAR